MNTNTTEKLNNQESLPPRFNSELAPSNYLIARDAWCKSIYFGDGPIANNNIDEIFRKIRATFLIKEQSFSESVDYAVKRAASDTVDIYRATLCRELANIIALSLYDFVDEKLETLLSDKTVSFRRIRRNSDLMTLAEYIFTVTYFDWFNERTTDDIRSLLDSLKLEVINYRIGSDECRYHRVPNSILAPLLHQFSHHYFQHYFGFGDHDRIEDCQHIEKFLRELERRLLSQYKQISCTNSPSVIQSTTTHTPSQMAKPSANRATLHKYNNRLLSELRSASRDEITEFLKHPNSFLTIKASSFGPDQKAMEEIVEIVTSLLAPLIRTFVNRRQRNAKLSLNKTEVTHLSEFALRRFAKTFGEFMSRWDHPMTTPKIVTDMHERLTTAMKHNVVHINGLDADHNRPNRQQAIIYRISEAARSWDLVELISDLFPEVGAERDYTKLMEVIWFELQESLYRPLEIAFDPRSFARSNFRSTYSNGKRIVCPRSNEHQLRSDSNGDREVQPQ